jgi:hypothetical protein
MEKERTSRFTEARDFPDVEEPRSNDRAAGEMGLRGFANSASKPRQAGHLGKLANSCFGMESRM